mmetsp:Transcript_30640/g.95211  ORF Transcript_30640/g.95211 Transcript_30640/m.95211 type:complete len:234 (-) Transcript_30640:3-704(-)
MARMALPNTIASRSTSLRWMRVRMPSTMLVIKRAAARTDSAAPAIADLPQAVGHWQQQAAARRSAAKHCTSLRMARTQLAPARTARPAAARQEPQLSRPRAAEHGGRRRPATRRPHGPSNADQPRDARAASVRAPAAAFSEPLNSAHTASTSSSPMQDLLLSVASTVATPDSHTLRALRWRCSRACRRLPRAPRSSMSAPPSASRAAIRRGHADRGTRLPRKPNLPPSAKRVC